MLLKKSMITAATAAGAAMAIVLAPLATAESPNQSCDNVGTATVCQSPGNSSIVTAPPLGHGLIGQSQANVQNGPYGSWGNLPPIR